MSRATSLRRAGALACAAALLVPACRVGEPRVEHAPPGSLPMTDRPFGLDDERFFSDPWATLEDVAEPRRESRESGVLIDAPGRVDVDAHDDVPVLALVAGTNREFAEAPFETSAVLTAVDLDEARLYAGRALTPDVPSELPPGFAEEPGFSIENHLLSLTRAAGVPLRPARLLVTVFVRDRDSNRCLVRLARGPGAYDDPAVAEYLASQAARVPPRRVDPPLGTPGVSYRRRPDSPDAPARGIALAAERVLVARDGVQVVLRGSFRVPVRACDVVRPIDGVSPDVGCDDALAVAPVQLLVIGSDDAAPLVVPLAVPIYEPLEPEGDVLLATGCFALDLARVPGFEPIPQTDFVRAFAGAELSSPLAVALVAEESLPGR